MFKIQLEEASKRFQYEWIFKNLSLELSQGNSLAITGSNGSGKSTLLKCLSGAIPITSGKIDYILDEKSISDADWFPFLTISAPYMELPEEFTLEELLKFHFKFKKPLNNISPREIIEQLYLTQHTSKPVGQFSSGMKQRLKLGLALFSDVPLVFLDEPTSNLDRKGIDWYQEMVSLYRKNRILVICSNEPREYEFCEQKIVLEDFK
ncbi:ABC-type multidrug transport system ATPase subunit [Algoriphagus ratkowskyi]|uniref:ABC transporter ATP-binding protein n=1 Tax=Algoriphagus ratkowskyi TaxID=57028 RepID=A0A2W7QS20_9BACT|nr:ATP-binding cassette domain-containing protein [Algoriphagus ratkowskyi]PZX51064.1 ABC-type multidrug transport system ATPase subunit [Algoriphagus ratkowskyi]TXD75854.1 ABC transporter ATP-binding protein [Algoriphagus ratkowskyi]